MFYYTSKPRGKGKTQPPHPSSPPPLCGVCKWRARETCLPPACGPGAGPGTAVLEKVETAAVQSAGMFHQVRGWGTRRLLPECPGQRAWGTHMTAALKPLREPEHPGSTPSSGSALLRLLLESPEDWLPGDGMAALVGKCCWEGAVGYKRPSKGKPQAITASSLITKVDGTLTGVYGTVVDYARSQGRATASWFPAHQMGGPLTDGCSRHRKRVSLGSWLSLGSLCKTTCSLSQDTTA